jgi:hypothetical protein
LSSNPALTQFNFTLTAPRYGRKLFSAGRASCAKKTITSPPLCFQNLIGDPSAPPKNNLTPSLAGTSISTGESN